MLPPRPATLPGWILVFAALCAAALLPVAIARAGIEVVIGPTAIPRGDARGKQDITINNGLFAIALAVDTAPPWGVARGGIVDIAIVRDGKVDYDIASLADFMPNNWSSWPTSYQKVSIEKHTADEVIVKTLRDWGAVALETRFTIRDGDSRIHMLTRMSNRGESVLEDLQTGYVVWPDGGYLFGVPGLPGVIAGAEDAALADWSAAYAEQWLLGLHAPIAGTVSYGGRDRYLLHTLRPGASKLFEAWLQIEPSGSLAPLVAAEIEFRHLPAGKISGRVVNAAGDEIERPAVVVLKNGKPYSWTVGDNGRYAMQLPAGRYELYATANAHARSEPIAVTVAPGGLVKQDFSAIGSPGVVSFEVLEQRSREPLDARISIKSGYQPLIEYFGKKTFFTELDSVGRVRTRLAPGKYQFEVSSGGGFTSLAQTLKLEIKPGATHTVIAEIPVLLQPGKLGWYSADLHHHSDVLDGFTAPGFVLRSELAAGMDIAFLSDHDSMVNNGEMQRLSARRGLPFIPATELSPSWAHFNAYPLDAGKKIGIDVGRASVQQIFAEARRLGADIVHVNHPYGDYGYFRSLEQQVVREGVAGSAVPGGFDRGFDLIEITAGANQATMTRTWELWNQGQRAYLAAGSDVHDVWNEESGAARTYAWLEGKPTVANYVEALKKGRSFASQGPLVYPEIVFGSELEHPAGSGLKLAYSVQAVSGLRAVRLIERGREIATRNFTGSETSAQLNFQPQPRVDTWYSLVIEDANGRFAYTNPVWVRLAQ